MDNPLIEFGALVNSIEGGGDRGRTFPQSDVEDLKLGADYIPDEVTAARRAGNKVSFVTEGERARWYWEFLGGPRHGKVIRHG